MRFIKTGACGAISALTVMGIGTATVAGELSGSGCGVGSGELKPCVQAHTFDVDGWRKALPEPLAREQHTDETPWIGQTGIAPPVAVSGDRDLNVRTSMSQWRAYQEQMANAKSVGIKPSDLSTKSLPKPPSAPTSPFDVWSSFGVQGKAGEGDSGERAGVGVDYRMGRAASIGVSAERSEVKPGHGTTLQDEKLAARVTIQATPSFSVDTTTQWETVGDSAVVGGGRIDKNTVTVSPKLKQSFSLDGGERLEPFVTYQREVGLGEGHAGGPAAATQSAGAGLTLAKPDLYAFSLSGDVTGSGTAEPPTLKSRLQLSIPLR